MRSRLAAAGALAALLALSACAHDGEHGPNGYPYMGGPDNFGEANRVTMAAQVVDPDPQYDTAIADSSGDHSAKAVERYRTDKVKKPDKVRTSSTATSGSSDGGSGGGSGGGN